MRATLEGQAGGAKALETAWLQQYGVVPSVSTTTSVPRMEAQKLAAALGADMNTTDGKAASGRPCPTRPRS